MLREGHSSCHKLGTKTRTQDPTHLAPSPKSTRATQPGQAGLLSLSHKQERAGDPAPPLPSSFSLLFLFLSPLQRPFFFILFIGLQRGQSPDPEQQVDQLGPG